MAILASVPRYADGTPVRPVEGLGRLEGEGGCGGGGGGVILSGGGDSGGGCVGMHTRQLRPAALLMQRFVCPDVRFIRTPWFHAGEHLHELDTLICRVRGNRLDGTGEVSVERCRRRGCGPGADAPRIRPRPLRVIDV